MTMQSVFRSTWYAWALIVAAASAFPAIAASTSVQKLIFVRHGEKPVNVDNGQLTCAGQNRALALPHVLLVKYGFPQYAFAGATVANKDTSGNSYYYLRALATIEPTAIEAGITVDLQFSNDDIKDLQTELAKSQYANALIFLAWEHNDLDKLVASIVKVNGGNPDVVPPWDDSDFDSIFVVTLTKSGSSTQVDFEHDFEGLDNLSAQCSPPRRLLPPPLLLNQ